jgi:hypothetical protein
MKRRLTAIISPALVLAFALAFTVVALAGGSADYSPTVMASGNFEGNASPLFVNNTATGVKSYIIEGADGNHLEAFTPSYTGMASAHHYLSYRDDKVSGAGLIYLGKDTGDKYSTLERERTQDFVTVDLDFGAEGGIPDMMSISLNGRNFKSSPDDISSITAIGSYTSPNGNIFVRLKDTNGTLEISCGAVDSGYVDTGIDISKEFVHLTLIVDLREITNDASKMKAYLYVNGEYFTDVSHSFSTTSDVLNELRIETGKGIAEINATDTVLVDNVLMRSFAKGEYTGNLGEVLADHTLTLSDFDLTAYDECYTLPSHRGVIAYVGAHDCCSLADVAKYASADKYIRFTVSESVISAAALSTIPNKGILYANADGTQPDGILYEIFTSDNKLYGSYTSADKLETVTSALPAGTFYLEAYGDITSADKILTTSSALDQTLTICLNGHNYNPTAQVCNYASAHGTKNLIFENGSLITNRTTLFQIAAGSALSTVSFKNLTIEVPKSLIKDSQKGRFTFENCDISWTQDCSDSSEGFISNFGGPTRSGVKNELIFKNCRINHTASGDAKETRAPFIGLTTIKTSSTEASVTTDIVIEGCEINHTGFLVFANANSSNTPNMGRPVPTMTINDSRINTKGLGTAYNGNQLTINVLGNTELNLTSKISYPSGSKTIGDKTYTSNIILYFGQGVKTNIKPAAATNVKVSTECGILTLAGGKGYIIEKTGAMANVSLNNDFTFNFYIPKQSFVSATVDGVALADGGDVTIGNTVYKLVSHKGIAPALAGIEKSAVITLTNGTTEYTASYSVSIPKYVTEILEKAATPGTDAARSAPLMAAIVNYIGEAYTYFGKTDGIDNVAALIELTKDIEAATVDVSALTEYNTVTALGGVIEKAELNLLSTPMMRFTFVSGYTGQVTIGGVTYEVKDGKVNGVSYVEVSQRAKSITSPITITAGGVSAKYNTVAYYNYLKGLSAADTNAAKAITVLDSLFSYGEESKNYIAHVYEEEYTYDANHHWLACTDPTCTAVSKKAAHTFDDDGLCICGLTFAFIDEDGSFLGALPINKTVKTELDDMKFAKELTGSATYTFTAEDKAGVNTGDMLLFSFVIRADVSTPIEIAVDVGTSYNGQTNGKALTYYAPTQWTRVYLPIKNNGMNNVILTTDGRVEIAEARFDNYGDATEADLAEKSGMWLIEDYEYLNVADKTTGVGASIDLVKSGDMIYSIGGGKLTVTRASTKEILGTLSGFGTLRQIDITDDGKYVIATARHDGVYIINVEDPTAPTIAATYNSIEMATGLYISGNYAFICNRQYGVEVVDISDPKNPSHLINIHSGEVQSCVVYNDILYAGVWGECGVYMYDLKSITTSSNPSPIGIVTTNGKGDGMSVCEIDGKVYLFAATGHHTYGASTSSPLSNLCYGQGNGLDIYDVTNPSSPIWVSTSKIDGRYYYHANDYWESEVAYDSESGKYYAYLVNTYNGVYVFDVTNPASPKREARFVISLPAGTILSHASRQIITPWDQTKEKLSPVGAIVIEDGTLYIAAAEYDLLILNHGIIHDAYHTDSGTASFDNLADNFYEFDNVLTGGTASSLNEGSYSLFDTDGQVLGAAISGNYLYLAAGAEGVLVLDKNTLEVLKTIEPATVNGRVGFANDVKVYGDRLYVASDIAGLRVYDIGGIYATDPSYLWSYTNGNNIVRQITISPEGKFSILQASTDKIFLINNSTGERILNTNATGGTMYHHNLSPVIDDRYVCFWNHVSYEFWLDFGPAGARLDVPVFLSTGTTSSGYFTGGMGMYNGVTSFTYGGVNYALKIQGSKAVYTNDFTKKSGTEIGGITTTGKPTVIGNYLLVSDRINSHIHIYDISNLGAAVKIGTLSVDGNPDVIISDGTKAYIPLGYQGMLVIDTAKAF